MHKSIQLIMFVVAIFLSHDLAARPQHHELDHLIWRSKNAKVASVIYESIIGMIKKNISYTLSVDFACGLQNFQWTMSLAGVPEHAGRPFSDFCSFIEASSSNGILFELKTRFWEMIELKKQLQKIQCVASEIPSEQLGNMFAELRLLFEHELIFFRGCFARERLMKCYIDELKELMNAFQNDFYEVVPKTGKDAQKLFEKYHTTMHQKIGKVVLCFALPIGAQITSIQDS